MSGISTKRIKKSFISRELKPGNITAKINNISIEQVAAPRDPNVAEYKIWLELEGKPMGADFVGFDKVFGDPSKGQYAGQIKKIQFSNWPIKTREGISKKSGKPYCITDVEQILEFLQKLLTTVGKETWLDDNDGKFNTFQEMFAAIVRGGLLKDKYLDWCLAATESVNAAGYAVYYMYIPEKREAAEPFAIEGGLVTKFEPSIHIKKNAAITQQSEALNSGVDDADEDSLDDDDPFATSGDEELFDMD